MCRVEDPDNKGHDRVGKRGKAWREGGPKRIKEKRQTQEKVRVRVIIWRYKEGLNLRRDGYKNTHEFQRHT